MQSYIDRALGNKRESRYIEFKSQFDINSKEAWCEIVKDVAAMANSGGGAIAFGLDSGGRPSGADVSEILGLDPAVITDKISRYTSAQFDGFRIFDATKSGEAVAILVIEPAQDLLVFTRPGTYSTGDGRQKTAFAQGTVYFRHGAKSEPATPSDLVQYVADRVDEARREWMQRVRRVVQAPPGYEIRVLPTDVYESDVDDAAPIRIVEDATAPGYRKIDPDRTHPFRQKELLAEVNKRLPRDVNVNSYDVLAVRRVHGTDDEARYCHKPKFGSAQYSKELARWMVERFNEDPHFFEKARGRFYDQRKSHPGS